MTIKIEAATRLAAAVTFKVWGNVVVDGKVYNNNDIKKLAGKKLGKWAYGDRDDIIVQTFDSGIVSSPTFKGDKGLQECLTYLSTTKAI